MLFPVRSPLLRESLSPYGDLIYIPHATEMFHFAWFPHIYTHVYTACILQMHGFPHSDTPGSKLICQLPEAFRRLSRPSSAHNTKASTIYPYLFQLQCSYSYERKPKVLSYTNLLTSNLRLPLSVTISDKQIAFVLSFELYQCLFSW